nr:MAG TPA: hypothetical protein [Caudoviricetes sp.]DAT49907.1 MAG TPA: hypothetical protein [Caudoviricetes sp.]
MIWGLLHLEMWKSSFSFRKVWWNKIMPLNFSSGKFRH